MRLNLGCGNDIREGYVNVDFRETHPSVQVIDLSKFPWPFEDASADEILMLDFLEHFPYATTPFILLECYRVLKPTGTVAIQVPDAEILSKALTNEGSYPCNRCNTDMLVAEKIGGVDFPYNALECPECSHHSFDIAEAAMKRMYGGQDFAGNYHQTCFTKDMLVRKAKLAGLRFIQFEQEAYQRENWNFKAIFGKTDLWENG